MCVHVCACVSMCVHVCVCVSSSSVVSPSALHSYVKRRFISLFAPPCYPWLSPLLVVGGVGGELGESCLELEESGPEFFK
jgi:hypothetical protein